jgi:hypothetical protein
MREKPDIIPLCYRCEYRAQFHERGYGPRYECGAEGAVYSCYMFRPCTPLTLAPNEGDGRPLMGGLFSCRYHATGFADTALILAKDGTMFHLPKSFVKSQTKNIRAMLRKGNPDGIINYLKKIIE